MASEEQQAKAEAIRDFAAKGNLEEIDKMVKENLEDVIWWINEGSSRGNTALQLAAMWGHVDCCQALLAAGADKDKQSNVSAPCCAWHQLRQPTTCAAALGVPAALRIPVTRSHCVDVPGRAHTTDVRRDQRWPGYRSA